MLATLKAGQTISCTVTASPRRADARDTIERLMRQDPAVKKGLRTAQRKRGQRMEIYNRGNRDWVKRERCARLVSCVKGATWSMTYVPALAPDLASVEKYLQITPG